MNQSLKLFSTQILHMTALSPNARLLKHCVEESYRFKAMDQAGLKWSGANYPRGYTSYGSIDQIHQVSPYFADLKKRIDRSVKVFLSELPYAVSFKDLQMSSFWINIMGQDSSHTMHIHPLSLISGTVYLQIPSGSSGIRFEDPRQVSFMACPPLKKNLPKFQERFSEFKVHPGQVILFESWLRHEVPRNKSTQDRISVSFNYDWI